MERHKGPGLGRLRQLFHRLCPLARRASGPAANPPIPKGPIRVLTRRASRPTARQSRAPTRPPPGSTGRILIVELGGWTCGSLPALLSQGGYEMQVVCGREAALGALEREGLVLFIVGGVADLDLYRALRRASAAPILALVPREDEAQVLSALATGVDQYQTGSISNGEAAAWARTLLRRGRPSLAVTET
jgi:CheY-like chemotaxis protein